MKLPMPDPAAEIRRRDPVRTGAAWRKLKPRRRLEGDEAAVRGDRGLRIAGDIPEFALRLAVPVDPDQLRQIQFAARVKNQNAVLRCGEGAQRGSPQVLDALGHGNGRPVQG